MKKLGITGDEGGMDVHDVADFLMLLSSGTNPGAGGRVDDADAYMLPLSTGRVFECKTCNRRFPSFQALGGHRASHKKPRLNQGLNGEPQAKPKPKTHECPICGLQFSTGQALGGHMRRHRGVLGDGLLVGGHVRKKKTGTTSSGGEKTILGLDLNLPPADNDAEIRLLASTPGLPVVVDSCS